MLTRIHWDNLRLPLVASDSFSWLAAHYCYDDCPFHDNASLHPVSISHPESQNGDSVLARLSLQRQAMPTLPIISYLCLK